MYKQNKIKPTSKLYAYILQYTPDTPYKKKKKH